MKHISFLILLFMAATVYGQKPGKKALLVIDVQENLVNPASKIHMDPAGMDSFFSNVNKSIDDFQAKDWPIIYIANEWTNPIMNLFTGNVCKKGAKGTGLDKKLKQVNDKIYVKSRGSALSNNELLTYLKNNSITELYLTGLFAEECVKATLNAGIRDNFNVTIILDAVGAKNKKSRARSIDYYKRSGAKLINADQL